MCGHVTGHVGSVAHTGFYELLHIRQLPIRALVLAMVRLELKQEAVKAGNILVTRQLSNVASG